MPAARKPAPGKSRPALQVWKFGGASLTDAVAVRRAVGLIAAHRGPLVVVASALEGVTDALLEGARASAAGALAAGSGVAAQLVRRHRALALELLPRGVSRRRLLLALDLAAREYRDGDRESSVAVFLEQGNLAGRSGWCLEARESRAHSRMAGGRVGGGRSLWPMSSATLVADSTSYSVNPSDRP